MEQLTALISTSSWDEALTLSATLGLSPSYVSQLHYLSLPSKSLTPELVEQLLGNVEDKVWVLAAAYQTARSSEDLEVVRKASEKGLAASDEVVESLEGLSELIQAGDWASVDRLCAEDPLVRKVCPSRKGLLELSDKMRTWEEIWAEDSNQGFGLQSSGNQTVREISSQQHGSDDGEGWDELDLPGEETEEIMEHSLTHPRLPTFISTPLLETVLALAASSSIESLKAITYRHSIELWPARFEIFAAIPEWEEPIKYISLLPRVDDSGKEQLWLSSPWRKSLDWSEQVGSSAAADTTLDRLSLDNLTAYYLERIRSLSSLGLISTALSLVQHCASLGISGLEEVGEELSLLSKLVYDRPSVASTSQLSQEDDDLTLDYWLTLSPEKIVESYLAHSSPSTIASDIRRLVLPYLSVLESRLERSGNPDPLLSNRLITDYILSLSSNRRLDLLVSIFFASNPTLSFNQRLIQSDADLARLALACLYGSTETNPEALILAGKIFEYLPAFEDASPPPASASMTLFDSALTNYTPSSLFEFVQSFSTPALSLALDALDLHLATSETFSRYAVPVPLSWFLSTHQDRKAQRGWATRMARTSGRGSTEFESEDEWEGLLEDMIALVDEEEGEMELKKGFWLLEKEEVLKIFFAGLLGSGKFSLAKRLLHPPHVSPPLSPSVEEELVITSSREFYDNAESGNLNKGEMKLAYDCLSAAPLTAAIKQERDFIEATSRLCSFKIYSHPGVPISPIEIRLSKDRLSFVSRLLSSNDDAYRHPDVILELVDKLGYRGDKLAKIKTLGMIADSALLGEDFVKTEEVCIRMCAVVEGLRRSKSPILVEGAEVTWRNCFQLGKHEEWDSKAGRMKILGLALVLCPGNKISTLLPVWNKLEEEVRGKYVSPSKSKVLVPVQPSSAPTLLPTTPSPTSPTSPAITDSSIKSKAFTRAAAFLPFSIAPSRPAPITTTIANPILIQAPASQSPVTEPIRPQIVPQAPPTPVSPPRIVGPQPLPAPLPKENPEPITITTSGLTVMKTTPASLQRSPSITSTSSSPRTMSPVPPSLSSPVTNRISPTQPKAKPRAPNQLPKRISSNSSQTSSSSNIARGKAGLSRSQIRSQEDEDWFRDEASEEEEFSSPVKIIRKPIRTANKLNRSVSQSSDTSASSQALSPSHYSPQQPQQQSQYNSASLFPTGAISRPSSAQSSSSSRSQSQAQERDRNVRGLFDSDSRAPSRPQERDVRDLWGSGTAGGEESGLRKGLSSTLTKGVGWLIGADAADLE